MNDKPGSRWPFISYTCIGAVVGLGCLFWWVAIGQSSLKSGPSMAAAGQAIILMVAIHAAGIGGVFAGVKGQSHWGTGLNVAAIVVFWIAGAVSAY